MTRRWYRERELAGFWNGVTSDGTAYVTTSYTENGRAITSPPRSSTRRTSTTSPARSRAARRAYPQGEFVYVDLYAAATAGEELANALKAALERADVPPLVQRVVLDVPAPRRGVSAADAITLRRSLDGGWELDRDLQFVHPEMAERLNLWRMSEFALERIAVARGRLPVPRRRPLEPQGRAAVRARRGARAERRARRAAAASSRCPSSSTCWPRRSSRCAASRPAARRASACCGTACG